MSCDKLCQCGKERGSVKSHSTPSDDAPDHRGRRDREVEMDDDFTVQTNKDYHKKHEKTMHPLIRQTDRGSAHTKQRD